MNLFLKRAEKSAKLEQQISELHQSMKTAKLNHEKEMEKLTKELCDLELREKEQNEKLISLRGDDGMHTHLFLFFSHDFLNFPFLILFSFESNYFS